jgi:hypothetical protein
MANYNENYKNRNLQVENFKVKAHESIIMTIK